MNITHNNNCYANNSSYSQDQKNLEDHAFRNALSDHPSSETPLFKRQEGAAQFIIQREGSGQLKAFLEEADGSRFPILLKGFPDRIASNQIETFRQLFAHTPIKRTGLFADFSCGLVAGGPKKRKQESENPNSPKVQKTTENQEISATSQLDSSRIFYATTKDFKSWLKSSGRTLTIQVDGKNLDDPSWSHYEVYKHFYKQLPSTTLNDTQPPHWKILSIYEKLYEREFIAKAIDGKDPLCCFLISQDLKSVDSSSFKYFLQNLPYYSNLDAIDNSNNLRVSIAQNIKSCLLKYIDNEDLLPRNIQLINDPTNQNSRNIYEEALLNFFDSLKDDDSVLMDKNSKVPSFIEEISFIFFKAAADFGFAPAQYSLSLNCKNLEKTQGYNEILFQEYPIQPAHYFFTALSKSHWEAVRDIQFMGVLNTGFLHYSLYHKEQLSLFDVLKNLKLVIDYQLKPRCENLFKISGLSKDKLVELSKNLTRLSDMVDYLANNNLAKSSENLTRLSDVFEEIEDICKQDNPSISIQCGFELIKDYLDIINGEIARKILLGDLSVPFNQDLSYRPNIICEPHILESEKYIKKIKNKDLKNYFYLEFAQLVADFNVIDLLAINHPRVQGITETNVKKIVKYFVKKSGKTPQIAYYLLIQAIVEGINDSHQDAYEEKIREYLPKIGSLGNFAMLAIQRKNLFVNLADLTNKNEITEAFNEKVKSWNSEYYPHNTVDHKKFINDVWLPNILNWDFSESNIKNSVFIQRFLQEKIKEIQKSNYSDKNGFTSILELRNAGQQSLLDNFQELNLYHSLRIKPKLNLNLNRKEQLKQFSSLNKRITSSKCVANYSPLVKKISEDTIALVKELCENIKQSLGTPPTNFEIFTLGSLARRESGFYTDFEVGIVLQENSIAAQIYFEKFSQKLADSLFMLEEHPDVGMHGAHLDTADNAPPHKRFEFRDFSDEQIMKQIRNAVGYRRKDDIPTAGSRIYLLAAEDFANFFKHNVLAGLDSGSIELSSFYSEKLEIIQAAFYIELNHNQKLGFNKNIFYKHVDQSGNLKDRILKVLKGIKGIDKIKPIDLHSKKSLFNSEWGPELLRLAKKEIKNQLVEEYIQSKNGASTERFKLIKEALPYVKKILNPLTPREIGVARSVPELGRNLDIVYTHNPSKQNKLFDLRRARDEFFIKSIPCQGLGIQLKNPLELGPLNQGQYISFKAIIELLNNKVSSQKLFTDTFDLSLDPKLPPHLIQKLNKGKSAKILPKKIDLKRAFYRIPEQILTGLSWFFRVKINEKKIYYIMEDYINTGKLEVLPELFDHYLSIIELLGHRTFEDIAKIFSEDLKREFEFLMNLGVKFRLQQQQKLKGECNEIYLHEETWRKELADQDAKIKILQASLERWTCLYRQDASLEDQNNYTDTLKNYLEALKKKSYLEKVGPDIFEPEEKMLFAQGFHSLKHIVNLTEKWIKNVQKGEKTGGLESFPNTL